MTFPSVGVRNARFSLCLANEKVFFKFIAFGWQKGKMPTHRVNSRGRWWKKQKFEALVRRRRARKIGKNKTKIIIKFRRRVGSGTRSVYGGDGQWRWKIISKYLRSRSRQKRIWRWNAKEERTIFERRDFTYKSKFEYFKFHSNVFLVFVAKTCYNRNIFDLLFSVNNRTRIAVYGRRIIP